MMLPRGFLSKVEAILTKINFGAAFLSGMMVFLLMVYNTYATCARYLFNAPPPGSTEVSTLIIPVITFLALAYTHEKGRHIVVDTVFERLSVRNQLLLSVMGNILIATFGAILFWKGGELSLGKFHEVSYSDIMVPLFPFYIFIPLGGLLLLLQSIRNIVARLLLLAKGNFHKAT